MNNVKQFHRQSQSENQNESQALIAHTLPLFGSHLIEASAGTGKTFNITRIYLRLLIERELSVENILVMTFTKAATEEIRGRIDQFLREALANWDDYVEQGDEYFVALDNHVKAHEKDYRIYLKSALINLDEAAIFTIHGFCKRVLSQQAFASGLSFNAKMEADDSELLLEAVQDYYRLIAADSQSENLERYQRVVEHWATPELFIKSFKDLIKDELVPTFHDEKSLAISVSEIASRVVDDLHHAESVIYQELIDNKKNKARDDRIKEFEELLAFAKALAALTNNLSDDSNCHYLSQFNHLIATKVDYKFIGKGRMPKSADKADIKQQLVDSFKSCEQLKKLQSDYDKALDKAQSYSLAAGAVAVIKQSIVVKKQQLSMLNFDDLISTLANALVSENINNSENNNTAQGATTSATLKQALLNQYPVALVDEFQDTDKKQFDILRVLYFADTNEESVVDEPMQGQLIVDDIQPALYLIGDPKQAIYGFRGGDIFTYLAASKLVDWQWMMDTNWRSSAEMIDAYNHLFYGGDIEGEGNDVFGFDISYSPVKASVNAGKEQLLDEKDYKALQLVNFLVPEDNLYRNRAKVDFRTEMANWCAAEISRLLSTAQLQSNTSKNDSTNTEQNALAAADIAILVRDGKEAADIKQALNRFNLPCVYKSERSNLFESDIASEFIKVLNAVINYQDDRAFVCALAGPFFGFGVDKLLQLQDDELAWERLREQFNRLLSLWSKRGFMAMALKLLHDHYPNKNKDNERDLTNIIHLFELLQSASQQLKQPQELLAYLQHQVEHLFADEAELRLESDANLIQIVTMHGSKGLEYPVVFAPFSTRHKNPVKFGTKTKEVLRYHNEGGDFKIHLGEDENAKQRMASEGYAEDIRLLYVAITRAKHRCYLGLVNFPEYHLSAIGQVCRFTDGVDITSGVQSLLNVCSNIGIDTIDTQHLAIDPYQAQLDQKQYHIAQFDGRIERDWWLSSFSALTRNHRHGGRTEPDRDNEAISENVNQIPLLKDSIRFDFTKGAKTGNLLHDLLEYQDFLEPNWPLYGSTLVSKFGEFVKPYQAEHLYDWLDDCLKSPLNSDGLSLSSLSRANTLREAEFYFPMEQVSISALKQLVQRYRESIGYGNLPVQLPDYGQLKGMMHGFIDLIFCADDKYYVCDYKSSHLGDSFSHYQQDKVARHVCENFYDLQFLIYSLALHRYLKIRVDDYDPELHFGGVYYLYLRGMSAGNKDFQGVFYDNISASFLEQLDSVFRGESLPEPINMEVTNHVVK
ncbi:exodeoxyribonuclease V subunit beta [Thalassotalea crassostreae]|uniref:exodeoxyribonuclease V subunit beta n=1 Tax=Thalassotalea crassostreae TaxID=1763536 RepID=UPI0008383A8F|nr:exodeoxyribonuclease V subunit beta [Thalassotalea crassostreae]